MSLNPWPTWAALFCASVERKPLIRNFRRRSRNSLDRQDKRLLTGTIERDKRLLTGTIGRMACKHIIPDSPMYNVPQQVNFTGKTLSGQHNIYAKKRERDKKACKRLIHVFHKSALRSFWCSCWHISPPKHYVHVLTTKALRTCFVHVVWPDKEDLPSFCTLHVWT